MNERYIRNLGALTAAEQTALRGKRVLVAGCGGLGGYLIELLARLGIGELRAADGDVFERSNLNRQLLSAPASLGRNKALAAKERVECIAPETGITAFPDYVTAENAPGLIRGCDAVLDGLDSASARIMLKAACDRERVPFIYGAVGGWTAQAALLLPGIPLPETLCPAEPPEDKSVPAPVPALCAAVQASLCLRLLLGRPVEPGRVYCFDLDDLSAVSFLL